MSLSFVWLYIDNEIIKGKLASKIVSMRPSINLPKYEAVFVTLHIWPST